MMTDKKNKALKRCREIIEGNRAGLIIYRDRDGQIVAHVTGKDPLDAVSMMDEVRDNLWSQIYVKSGE